MEDKNGQHLATIVTELPADIITYEKESGDFGVSFHCTPQSVLDSQ